ncbi:eliciting plant response-like protein [Xylaria nigripes]|nr:eliciting plant response-like protein [Xylaria nigripes]
MQLTKIFNLLSLTAAASAVTVAYDQGYDDPNRSMTLVACSDGVNGLITRYGWQTQGAIPSFFNIGGAQAVEGWGSVNCGTCWQLSYGGKSVNILAVDHSNAGFTIALEAMNTLTNGQAEMLGRIEATAVQVDVSACGI